MGYGAGEPHRRISGPVGACVHIGNDLQRRTIDSTLLMENEYAQDVSQLGKSLLWSYDFSKKTHPYIPLAQIHSQDKENVEKFFELCRKGKEPPSLEFRGKEKDISPLHWYRIFGVILKDECGIPTQAVGHIEDIQLEKEQSARLELATHCDSMTGLYHMTYMHQELDRFLQQFGEEVNGAFFIMILMISAASTKAWGIFSATQCWGYCESFAAAASGGFADQPYQRG